MGYTKNRKRISWTCCGALFDVELNIDYNKSQELLGCDIEEKHIYFKGICRNCKDRSN